MMTNLDKSGTRPLSGVVLIMFIVLLSAASNTFADSSKWMLQYRMEFGEGKTDHRLDLVSQPALSLVNEDEVFKKGRSLRLPIVSTVPTYRAIFNLNDEDDTSSSSTGSTVALWGLGLFIIGGTIYMWADVFDGD